MIGALAFEPARGRLRRACFVPRAGLSVEAACAIANGLGEALRGVLGQACTLTIGEPLVLDAAAWRSLVRDALAFALPGRVTDVVFVLPRRHARSLVAAAFREDGTPHEAAWTALELGAMERIIARCAPACDQLCGDRCGPVRAVDPGRLDPCVDFFDVRVAAPICMTIGVGIARAVRDLPPASTVSQRTLGAVRVDTQIVLGRATMAASRLLNLRPGDVLRLDTKIAGEAELNVAGRRIARGTCGVVKNRAAFDVQSTCRNGDAT